MPRRRKHRTHKSRRRLSIVAGALVATLLLVATGLWYGRRYVYRWLYRTDSRTVKFDGIDVSHHNGTIRWDEVSTNENIRFAYVKATEGVGHVDRKWRRNVREAERVGIAAGLYHFYTSRTPAERQFAHFSHTAGSHLGSLVPMIDVEPAGIVGMGRRDLQREIATFSRLCQEQYGRKPVIYTTAKIYEQMLAPDFNDHYIWIANYRREPVLTPPARHNIWQFSEYGIVAGIDGYTDLNVFTNGMTLDRLKW